MSQRIKLFLLSTFVLFAASLNAWAYDDWTSTNTGEGSTSSEKTWDTFSVPGGKYVLVDYEVNGTDKDYLYLGAEYNFNGSQRIYGKKNGTFVIYNSESYSRTLRIYAYFYRKNGGDGYAKVTNIRIVDEAPEFTEISLTNNKNVELGVNMTYQNISVTSSPLYAQRSYMAKNVTWKSSNENIATVDANGNVTGVGAGTATITVTANDGSKVSSSCDVTVKKTEKITLNDFTVCSMNYDSNAKSGRTIPIFVTPQFCSNNFAWKTSDENIATVDKNGIVYGKKEGTAIITATTTDGTNISASCNVNVINKYVYNGDLSSNDNIRAYAYTDYQWDYIYVTNYGDSYYKVSGQWNSDAFISNYGTQGNGTLHIEATSNDYCRFDYIGNSSNDEVTVNGINSDGWREYYFNDDTYIYRFNPTINFPPGTNEIAINYNGSTENSEKDFFTISYASFSSLNDRNFTEILASNTLDVVRVSREGILGAEALKIHENLADFKALKIIGPLDEYDWKTIAEMGVECLDLTEASGVYPASGNFNSIEAVKLSNNITDIARNYFPYAKYVYVPDGVTSISSQIGYYWTNDLFTLEGCKGVRTIADDVFKDYNLYGSLSFPNLEAVGKNTFKNCSLIESISLPKLKTIGSNAFDGCICLKNVEMSNVTTLGDYAFSNCGSLTTISAPKLKKISPFAFYKSKMDKATFAEVDTIGKYAFALAGANSITCAKAKYIGEGAFSSVYKYSTKSSNRIGTVSIPSVEVICDSAFYHQGDIDKLVTPNLKKIGEYAFAAEPSYSTWNGNGWDQHGVNKLASIDLSSVTEIGKYAFLYCNSLKNISLPNVARINEETFYNCYSIKSLDAPRATYIGNEAFWSCNSLETINILKADTIGAGAFSGCSKIQQVNLPKVAFLGSSAFYNCTSVKDIELSDKLTALGENSFYGCTGVETLTLPASITKIPTNCFAGSNNIKVINCNAPAPPAVGETPFNMQTLYTATLRVPEPSIGLYQADTYWKHFYYYDTNPDVLTDLILSNVTDMGDVRMEKVNLTMNIGSCLSMSGNDAQSFRSVTFKANNTGTGMFISSSERISSDDTKIEFNMDGLKWYFISLPYDVNISDIERSTEGTQLAIYKYDGAKRASSGTGYAWTRVNSGTLAMGTGYILQVSKATTLTFPASFAQKDKAFQPYDVTTKLSANTSSTAANQGWNFVGNPYLAYYDISKLDFSAPVTVWTGSTYAAYTPSDDEFALKPMQPFFVQCPTNVKSIKFSAEGRQATATITKAAEARERGNVKSADRRVVDIAIYSDSEAEDDHTRFVVNSRATDDYEMNCDAAKMMSMDDKVAQIYTVSRGVQYAINEGPQLTGEVQIGFRTPKAGTYTLKAVRSDMDVMLLDEVTGETVNLSEGAYTFNAEEEVNETRFRVVLGSEITDINDVDADKAGEGTELYDLSGRRTAEPAKGVSIMRQNGKVSKQMNR